MLYNPLLYSTTHELIYTKINSDTETGTGLHLIKEGDGHIDWKTRISNHFSSLSPCLIIDLCTPSPLKIDSSDGELFCVPYGLLLMCLLPSTNLCLPEPLASDFSGKT